jgi:hypothetical protein
MDIVLGERWRVVALALGQTTERIEAEMTDHDKANERNKASYFLRQLGRGKTTPRELKAALQQSGCSECVDILDRHLAKRGAAAAASVALRAQEVLLDVGDPAPRGLCRAVSTDQGVGIPRLMAPLPSGHAGPTVPALPALIFPTLPAVGGGAKAYDPAALATALKTWNERYGVQLAGSVVQFVPLFTLPQFEGFDEYRDNTSRKKWDRFFAHLLAVHYPVEQMVAHLRIYFGQHYAVDELEAVARTFASATEATP